MAEEPLNKIGPIINEYGLNLKRVRLETSKEKKAVWWIDTDRKKYILKKVPLEKGRLIFILSAVEHLRDRGVNIPEVCRTLDGSLFVESGGDLYILMEAVVGKPPGYDKPWELAKIVEGMATFHLASKEFCPPPGAVARRHLGKWEKKFAESVSDLQKFKEISANAKNDFERFYHEQCDYFIKEGKECLKLLADPSYARWVNKVQQETNLCHQDFAAGNLGLVNGKLYIYDLDSITIDLPARDIRKILNKVMKKRSHWDLDLTKQMLGCYRKVNPLTPDEFSVVFTDVRFPHLFYGIASKYFINRETEWSSAKYLRRLQEMTEVERSKNEIIKREKEITSVFR